FSDPGPVFHTIVSIKNDGHYFCRAGGNRPDGLNEPVTDALGYLLKKGDITDAEYRAALEIDPRQSISVHLPYSQTYL
ncbi:hypothetical protein, partial [Escherichia coli]|uniref:hypothetical protein n=1 Tax=Escherichia coli TaxID=562 RepID=UPI001BCF2A46